MGKHEMKPAVTDEPPITLKGKIPTEKTPRKILKDTETELSKLLKKYAAMRPSDDDIALHGRMAARGGGLPHVREFNRITKPKITKIEGRLKRIRNYLSGMEESGALKTAAKPPTLPKADPPNMANWGPEAMAAYEEGRQRALSRRR